jgi:hypothetical protein
MSECLLRSFDPLSPRPLGPANPSERMHIRLQDRLLFLALIGILLAQPHYGA